MVLNEQMSRATWTSQWPASLATNLNASHSLPPSSGDSPLPQCSHLEAATATSATRDLQFLTANLTPPSRSLSVPDPADLQVSSNSETGAINNRFTS